jgi:hypothetical protein
LGREVEELDHSIAFVAKEVVAATQKLAYDNTTNWSARLFKHKNFPT